MNGRLNRVRVAARRSSDACADARRPIGEPTGDHAVCAGVEAAASVGAPTGAEIPTLPCVRRHPALFVAAIIGVLVAAGWPALGQKRGQAPPMPGGTVPGLEAAIAGVETGRMTTPIIGVPTVNGEVEVTFLASRRGGRVPRIVSDVTGWGERADGTFDSALGTMTRVGRTDWYSLRASVALGARIEYQVAYGASDYRFDPHNPRRSAGEKFGGAPASHFVTPGYLPPREFADPPVVAGGLVTRPSVASPASGALCRVIVYTPPGHRKGAIYPMAVFLDRRFDQVSRVLDWLIAHRAMEPIVAVFVGPESGGGDDQTAVARRTFLTEELPEWMESQWNAGRDVGKRAIVGISFGAKDALDAALAPGESPDGATTARRHVGTFGRVGLLIHGRRLGPSDIESIAGRSTHHLRVAILAGRYDGANVATARGVRRALAEAGHAVEYTEVPEGPSAVTWTHHLRTVLISLFGCAS